MGAGVYNFTIEQGADFKRTFTWLDADEVPIDLTGYSAKLMIRLRERDEDFLLLFDSETNPDADGDIALGGVAGTIIATAEDAITELLAWKGSAHYDLLLTDPFDEITRLLKGRVRLSLSVTREEAP